MAVMAAVAKSSHGDCFGAQALAAGASAWSKRRVSCASGANALPSQRLVSRRISFGEGLTILVAVKSPPMLAMPCDVMQSPAQAPGPLMPTAFFPSMRNGSSDQQLAVPPMENNELTGMPGRLRKPDHG